MTFAARSVRKWAAGLPFGVALSLVLATTAVAAVPNKSLGSIVLEPPALLAGKYTFDFRAKWTVNGIRDGGINWWTISKPQLNAWSGTAGTCITKGSCNPVLVLGKAELLNAAGSVVRTITLISDNACYWDMQGPGVYRYAANCSTWQHSQTSVNRIRFSARLQAHIGGQAYWTNWLVKTFPITG